jgi:hypothetical protein
MSYASFLAQSSCVSTAGRIVQHPCELPEHREDEAFARDPVFDTHPDDFQPMPPDLSTNERILFQEGRKVRGKVVAPHEATVRTPWYQTAQYIARRLGCSHRDAATLADCWAILDADEAMVEQFVRWVKARGIAAALAYFQTLATAAAEAETVDPEDALEASRLVDLADVERGLTPEIDPETYPRDDVEWSEVEWDAVDAWLEGSDPHAAGVDVTAPRVEEWHLLDEPAPVPAWEDRQPAAYRILLERARRAETLEALKAIGQPAYAETRWTATQKQVFWSAWQVRREALLADAQRHPTVQRALRRIQTTAVLAEVGRRLHQLQQQHPSYFSAAGWAIVWAAYHARKEASHVR